MLHLFKQTFVILFALFVVFTGTALAAEAPQDVPGILQKAIDERDGALAEAHLDFDKIVANFFEVALPQINEAVESGSVSLMQPLPVILGSLNSGKPATRLAAQVLMSAEARKFTLYGVNSGTFTGRPIPAEEAAKLDGGLFLSLGNVSIGRKEFSPGRLISQSGDSAIVQTTMRDYDSKGSYPLKLQLEKRGGAWMVTGVRNAGDLMSTVLKEAEKQR